MARQQRAIHTRNALMESAAELFVRDGYVQATLADISARAGVSNGALHFHFTSKAALAGAVEAAAALRFGRITGGDLAPPGAGGSLQVLIDATHALSQGLGSDVVLRAGFDLRGGGSGEDLYGRWQEWVEGALARAGREGALAGDVTVRDGVIAVVAATAGFAALGSGDARWLSRATVTRFWVLLLPRLASASALPVLVASGRPGGNGVPAPR